MGKKKVNPRRRPASMADVERAKNEAVDEATSIAMAMFFTVLCDKHGATAAELQTLWAEITELSSSVAQGYVSVSDLLNTLKKEYEVNIR